MLLQLELSAELSVDLEVITSPTPQVTIDWNDQGSTPVFIRKRELGILGYGSWGTVATYPEDGTSPYIDTDVVDGQSYEYRVDVQVENEIFNYEDNFMSVFPVTINAPLDDSRDAVLLVVEETWVEELSGELAKLELDLAGDGWEVFRLDWARSGNSTPEALKAAIQAQVAAHPQIDSLFLFGTLPVVSSGYTAPDGHEPRPHETDMFYADLDEWADVLDNSTYTPGDGVYDTSYLTSDIELATGRVTFHSMDMLKKEEVEYLRDYIHKDHAYRNLHRNVPYTAHGGDNLQANNNRVFKTILGAENFVGTGDHGETVDSDGYLFAYDNHIETSWDAGLDSYHKSIFTSCFRSYNQEFWNSNNKMRRLMGQPDWGLTAIWGARPTLYFHHMAAGGTIGHSARINWNDIQITRRSSSDGVYYSQRDYYYMNDTLALDFISVNLLGDPTLRIAHVEPVHNLAITRTDSNTVQLDWSASGATDLIGYHIYSSTERLGQYTRLTTTPITDTSYTASAATGVDTWFQVRAVANVTVPTGVYADISQARFALAYADSSVNRAPVAVDDDIIVKVNTFIPIDFGGSDADGDDLTPIVVDNPDNGQIRWFEGQPYYVSKRDTAGVDTVRFVLFDGVSVSEPATITFTATEIGDTLVAWEFAGSDSEPREATFSVPGLSSSPISNGPGTSRHSSSNGHSIYSVGQSLDPSNDYMTWTLTPDDGLRFSLDSINISVAGYTNDIVSYELRASADGFDTYETIPMRMGQIAGRSFGSNDGFMDTGDASGVSVLQNQSDPVEFRLHFWHTGSSGTPVGVGKIDDYTSGTTYYDANEDISLIGTITTDAGLPLILTTTKNFSVDEEGSTTIGLGLSTEPSSPVTINISRVSGDTDLSFSTTDSLIFDETNWMFTQEITFSAAYDIDDQDGVAVFELSATGLNTLELTVTEVDNALAPVASAEAYGYLVDTPLVVAAPGVLDNDTDGNGDTLTAILVDDVTNGDLELNADGSFTYTPDPGFKGQDNFTYYATDGVLNSETVTVTLVLDYTELEIEVFGESLSYEPLNYDSGQIGNAETLILDGTGLRISGNGWFMLDLSSIEITENTVLSFDFQSEDEAEINGIGFDTDVKISAGYTFQFWGTQTGWGDHQLEDYGTTMPETKHYEIKVGDYYTGTFRYLFFAHDDDVPKAAIATYSNIRIYEQSASGIWASARGLSEIENNGLNDDANGDGKSNLYHFAFDTDPLGYAGDEGKQSTSLDEVNGETYLTLTIPVRSGASFRGTPLESLAIDGVIYRIHGNSKLSDPTGDLSVEEISPAQSEGLPDLGDYDGVDGADWEYRSFRLTDPLSSASKAFIWFEVELEL